MIANSGSTCDSTPHEAGIKIIQNGKSGDSITNSSDYDMARKYVGNIHVSECKNKGKVVNKHVI